MSFHCKEYYETALSYHNFGKKLYCFSVSGYRNVDRHVGFDYDTTKLIVRDMAVMHAVPIAFRLKKPDVFAEEIGKLCENSFGPPPPPPDGKHPGPPGGPPGELTRARQMALTDLMDHMSR